MDANMEGNKVGLGVVGCGSRIKGLLSGLPNLGKAIELRAAYDPDSGRIEGWLDGLGANPKICGSYEELLAMPEVDWVAVAAWNSLHAKQAAQALSAGKHVFCEKPLATCMDDAVLLRKAALSSDRLFLVGFTLRYSSFYRRLKELLDAVEIGRILSMEFNETLGFNHGGHIMSCWRRLEEFTGSHILEKCCHDIDIANWLLESRACKVASFGGLDFFTPGNAHLPETMPRDGNGERAYCQWPTARGKNPFLTDKDIVDNQVAILEFANGARATFHTNLNAGIPERRFYILGEKGAIRGDMNAYCIELGRIGFGCKPEKVFSEEVDWAGHGGADSILCRHWSDLMLGRAERPLSTVDDGLAAAATCFAIEEARKAYAVVDMKGYWSRLASCSASMNQTGAR